jgi:flagellar basal-body rod modification protein FlgD
MSTTAESGFLISEQDRYEYQQSQQRQVKSELDKDAFMHLLMMEMKHQDPLEPISNKEMMGQLTQFTSVEQLQQLNEKFDEFISINSQSKWG